MLAQFLQGEAFAFFLIFARVGAGLMLLPGFGETYVSPRIRLLFALALTLVVHPLVRDGMPELPEHVLRLFLLVLGEIVIGLFFGAVGRIMIGLLHTAGLLIAHATNLAAAQMFDPSQGTPGSVTGNFLGILGVVLIFVTNLHHLMLRGLVQSYTMFPPGTAPPVDDFAELATRLVANGFAVALQIAAPLMMVALMFQVGLGLLARLMPQMHVYFIGMPLQILLGFSVFAFILAAAMNYYLERFAEPFTLFLGGG